VTPPRDDAPRNPSQWIKGNLVGLGSAAVLAVYSAGYARTREAAKRFEGEDRQRHVAIPVAAVATAPEVATKVPIPQPVSNAVLAPSAPKTPAAKTTRKSSESTEAKPSTPVADTATAHADTASTAPQPATQAPAPAPTDTAKSEKTQVGWKDGTFTGWGGSRHGDIQATVEIKAGRITSAWISICATQYSCSWIDTLPGQVVARQSPEVDFVSGATQSTNAFYYAVVQALQKAK
jgi:uncharacterized protein with FMN-binding domain